LMMSLWDALRMNMMISYQELVRTFPYRASTATLLFICSGQQKLVTISDFFQYLFSNSFGGNPPLYS
ncbi:hypothetical protein OSL27_20295, partial [Escherichia coli]|nr:hypothetical protein [Escherichia coli]